MMNTRMPERTQPAFQELTAHLETQPGVLAAVVFGSAAVGRLRPESDLDLAVLFADDAVPNEVAALELRATLEQRTGRDVDLVVLNRASTILAFQAAKKGRLIVCKDPRAYQRYLVRLISEYADFKRIRRPIEEAVLRRRLYD
jgi:predicted nucleotidyltransferase